MICISKYEFSKEDYEMYKSFFENRLDKIEIVSTDSVKPINSRQKMPDRILEYCMETMREIKENRNGISWYLSFKKPIDCKAQINSSSETKKLNCKNSEKK